MRRAVSDRQLDLLEDGVKDSAVGVRLGAPREDDTPNMPSAHGVNAGSRSRAYSAAVSPPAGRTQLGVSGSALETAGASASATVGGDPRGELHPMAPILHRFRSEAFQLHHHQHPQASATTSPGGVPTTKSLPPLSLQWRSPGEPSTAGAGWQSPGGAYALDAGDPVLLERIPLPSPQDHSRPVYEQGGGDRTPASVRSPTLSGGPGHPTTTNQFGRVPDPPSLGDALGDPLTIPASIPRTVSSASLGRGLEGTRGFSLQTGEGPLPSAPQQDPSEEVEELVLSARHRQKSVHGLDGILPRSESTLSLGRSVASVNDIAGMAAAFEAGKHLSHSETSSSEDSAFSVVEGEEAEAEQMEGQYDDEPLWWDAETGENHPSYSGIGDLPSGGSTLLTRVGGRAHRMSLEDPHSDMEDEEEEEEEEEEVEEEEDHEVGLPSRAVRRLLYLRERHKHMCSRLQRVQTLLAQGKQFRVLFPSPLLAA